MSNYFNRFPFILYALTGNSANNPLIVRNIFFRLKIIDLLETNTLVYYPYYIKENESPEIIAYKYYKDIEKHWLVLLANKIVDPQFDWPLSDNSFQKYIINKYGSIAQAQGLIKNYIQTTSSVDSDTGLVTNTTVIIDQQTYNSTPAFIFQEINLQNGTTVAITTTTDITYTYDNEYQNNENKKHIQLIDKRYVSQLDQEFRQLTAQARR